MIKKYTFTVIDDDIGDIEILKRYMSMIPQMEINVVTVNIANIKKIIEGIKQADLIFIDYMLGNTNGLEIFKAIQNHGYNIPVIMLTGQGNESVAVEALKCGVSDYLSKDSLSTENLIRVINYVFEKWELNKKIEDYQHNLEKKIKERTQALRKSEERFRTIFETAKDGIFIKNKDLKYELINPSMENLLQMSSSQIIGKSDDEIYIKEEALLIKKIDLRVLSGETIKREHTQYIKNKRILFDIIKVPMRDKEGNITGICGISRDITKTRQLELQLHQTQKMEALGQLAGGIAHDFNTLLGTILGYAQIMKTDIPKESINQQDINMIIKAGHRARDIIKQIKDFSRPKDSNRENINVAETINEALTLIATSFPVKNEIKNTEDIINLTINADKSQMHQIIMNLCSNANDAISEKNGEIKISLEKIIVNNNLAKLKRVSAGNYVKISVSDTGCGIEKEVVERIFEPFFTTKDIGKGSGLGLSIVHGIVKSHNGFVSLQSKIGKGSIFNIFLPIS